MVLKSAWQISHPPQDPFPPLLLPSVFYENVILKIIMSLIILVTSMIFLVPVSYLMIKIRILFIIHVKSFCKNLKKVDSEKSVSFSYVMNSRDGKQDEEKLLNMNRTN